jgi:hypothetical protein
MTTIDHATWHVIRASDHHYIETFRGSREEAEAHAAKGVMTVRGRVPAYLLEAEPDYPATEGARRMYGDRYADYIQGALCIKALRGISDRRTDSLGALLAGNDGD